jgi:hypothetical protein
MRQVPERVNTLIEHLTNSGVQPMAKERSSGVLMVYVWRSLSHDVHACMNARHSILAQAKFQ